VPWFAAVIGVSEACVYSNIRAQRIPTELVNGRKHLLVNRKFRELELILLRAVPGRTGLVHETLREYTDPTSVGGLRHLSPRQYIAASRGDTYRRALQQELEGEPGTFRWAFARRLKHQPSQR